MEWILDLVKEGCILCLVWENEENRRVFMFYMNFMENSLI